MAWCATARGERAWRAAAFESRSARPGMAETGAALRGLCEAFGIAAGYHDIWGRWVEAPAETLVAVLGEFGVQASSQQAIESADARVTRARARRLLEPVLVVDDGADALRVEVRVPARCAGATLDWRLIEEGGALRRGQCVLASLERLAAYDCDDESYELRSLGLGAPPPHGYHRLEIEVSGLAAGTALLVSAPARCHIPPDLDDGRRIWGPAVQLYALRSQRNWGIGDFTDLLALADLAASRGADIVGLNPMHAPFSHDPAHCSPYSPSSRAGLNPLYLDVEAIEDFAESEAARRLVGSDAFQARLAALRAADLVDYAGVARAKDEALRLAYRHFRTEHLEKGRARGRAFRAFQREHGRALRTLALFEALQAHFHAADPGVWGWPAWPQPYRDRDSEAVARFEAQHETQVEYHEYLQWQASLQIGRASTRCEALGMSVGLYMDLAVSVDRGGADAWGERGCLALGASVGAPPDDFNLKGQDWGLPPLAPHALRECGYRPFVQALRANMMHAGALRIDHVMGLMRLFWIPAGADAQRGVYVHYRLDEMLAIVALESSRNRCMVIGEDLGTVPDEVRCAMNRRALLSYRLLVFERDGDGGFRPPAAYPRLALTAISTHDLPTLAGWWAGDDLRLRDVLQLFPTAEIRDAQRAARERDRPLLLQALAREGLIGDAVDAGRAELPVELAIAAHAFVARSPAAVMVVQLEDLLGMREQANLPGTTDQHPNWRRKLPLPVADLAHHPRFVPVVAAVASERPHPLRVAADPSQPAVLARVRATYRLQLDGRFDCDAAAAIVPYLARLGISHLYCSPLLAARPGSTHGYDIVDHGRINPDLGGEAGLERLVATLRRHGMGLIFDMVPNHMGVLGADNACWMDVLEHGRSSRYAEWFDIDWNPVNADLAGKVLVPVLGDHYGLVLGRGELALVFERERGTFAVRYFEHRLPVDPRCLPSILEAAARRLAAQGHDAQARALEALAGGFGELPARDEQAPEDATTRATRSALLAGRLAQLARSQPAVADAIQQQVARTNGAEGAARESLHELLERQAYRLAHWRVAADEINYRRFFDINELAALRMELPEVFEATHALTLDLAARGLIDGLRIDHSDGLYDPGEYFARLQQGYARRTGAALVPGRDGRPARPLYVLIEKIAAGHERVPEHWAVHGTTGYRFAAVVNGVFVDAAAKGRIDRTWRAFTGERGDFELTAYQGKRAIMRSALASELTVLATELLRIARADRRTRDYTFNTLRQALAEVAACMPVYRTYFTGRASTQDRRYVDWAVARATRRSLAADTTIFAFVRQTLLGRAVSGAPASLVGRVQRFAMRFQQFTAPVTAKGVEDTACYVFNRLVSLNEVGSDPEVFGFTVSAFHGASADRALVWPDTMLAGSTHDNKRSEDVRQRINVISEVPAAWRMLLRRWRILNRSKRRTVGGEAAPSRNDEYLLYQTLLGTLPDARPGGDPESDGLDGYRERIEAYMLKAAREAKRHTSWISRDERYEGALVEFVRGLLARSAHNVFLAELREQARFFRWFGALNSLGVTILRCTSPGVPDFYQGCEVYDFSLVDPDNRRPVDYEVLARMLDELATRERRDGPSRLAAELAGEPCDPRTKLFVVSRLLGARAREPRLFRSADYRPLEVSGAQAHRVLAFARRAGDRVMVVIVGRLFAGLLGAAGRLPAGEVWGDTDVQIAIGDAPGGLVDALTGEPADATGGRVRVAAVLRGFPGAVLIGGCAPAAALQ